MAAPKSDFGSAAAAMMQNSESTGGDELASAIEALFNARDTASRVEAFRRAFIACEQEPHEENEPSESPAGLPPGM